MFKIINIIILTLIEDSPDNKVNVASIPNYKLINIFNPHFAHAFSFYQILKQYINSYSVRKFTYYEDKIKLKTGSDRFNCSRYSVRYKKILPILRKIIYFYLMAV